MGRGNGRGVAEPFRLVKYYNLPRLLLLTPQVATQFAAELRWRWRFHDAAVGTSSPILQLVEVVETGRATPKNDGF